MLYLSSDSNRIIDRIIAIGNGQTAFQINNQPGAFMPLHVELQSDIVIPALGLCKSISFAHYGEQNGDLMRDPEMCILQSNCGARIAYYYRNDYAGVETDARNRDTGALHPGKISEYNEFLTMWLTNIREQQNLTPANLAV